MLGALRGVFASLVRIPHVPILTRSLPLVLTRDESTMKRRRKMMNKHKHKKRRRKDRMKNKK